MLQWTLYQHVQTTISVFPIIMWLNWIANIFPMNHKLSPFRFVNVAGFRVHWLEPNRFLSHISRLDQITSLTVNTGGESHTEVQLQSLISQFPRFGTVEFYTDPLLGEQYQIMCISIETPTIIHEFINNMRSLRILTIEFLNVYGWGRFDISMIHKKQKIHFGQFSFILL